MARPQPATTPEPVQIVVSDDGRFPNSRFPTLIYRDAEPDSVRAEDFETRFAANDWRGGWRDGIFSFHHYHSTAHEVLGVYAGAARVQLGGPKGEIVDVSRGDVIVIPAGVGHCNLESDNLSVVGAYAAGRRYDLLRGRIGDRRQALRNIAQVPLPVADPVTGSGGALVRAWR